MRSRRAATEARAGQASEAGGGAAGGQNGGGGGTLEDPFHSTQTPCCRRGLELVSGIFPEVAEGGAGSSSSSLSGEGSQAPAGSSAQQQQLADDGGGPESNILALVVRQHLLNERRNRGGGGGASKSGGRKRKKKRKKKKGGETSTAASPSGVTQLVIQAGEVTAPAVAVDDAGAAAKIDATGSRNGDACPSSPPSPFDHFLDKVLAGPEGGGGSGRAAPENRELPSFVAYLNARYQEHMRQTGDGEDGNRCSTTTTKKRGEASRGGGGGSHAAALDPSRVYPTIAFDRLYRMIGCSCRKCFYSSNSILQTIAKKSGTNGFLLEEECVVVPTEGSLRAQLRPVGEHFGISEGGIEIEQAFDYIALEEGMGDGPVGEGGPGTGDGRSKFRLQLDSVPDIRGDYNLLRMQALDSRPTLLGVQDVERLVTHILVPCSVGVEKLVEMPKASEGDEANTEEDSYYAKYQVKIHMAVKIYHEAMEKLVTQLETLRDECERRHQDAASQDTGAAFAPQASKALSLCESSVEEYFAIIVSLICQLTRISVGVCSRECEEADWARRMVDDLWSSYDQYLQPLIDCSVEYKASVMSKSPGVKPQPFYNASWRRDQKKFLNKKISAVYKMQDHIMNHLVSEVSGHSSLNGLQKFCVVCGYYAYPDETPLYKETHISDMAGKLLDKRQNIICKSYSNTLHESFFDEQNASTAKYSHALDDLETRLDLANRSVSDTGDSLKPLTDLMTTLTLSRQSLEERSSNLKFLTDDKDLDVNVLAENSKRELHYYFDRSKVLCLEWRILILRQYRQSDSFAEARQRCVPVNLLKWAEGALVDGATESNDSDSKPECSGVGGRRRVSCIVATMIFDWLQERCMEWHAELTHKELLAAMEKDDLFFSNDPTQQITSGGKSSSKKKKAKKKKAATSKLESSTQRDMGSQGSSDINDGSKSEDGSIAPSPEEKLDKSSVEEKSSSENSSVVLSEEEEGQHPGGVAGQIARDEALARSLQANENVVSSNEDNRGGDGFVVTKSKAERKRAKKEALAAQSQCKEEKTKKQEALKNRRRGRAEKEIEGNEATPEPNVQPKEEKQKQQTEQKNNQSSILEKEEEKEESTSAKSIPLRNGVVNEGNGGTDTGARAETSLAQHIRKNRKGIDILDQAKLNPAEAFLLKRLEVVMGVGKQTKKIRTGATVVYL